ncbi:LysR substrate-binding domain-containing protein [Agromyces atrinae]|uniref:LysR family transcriptional regulator n=1 Tax=Agromyces atrinae TaxID=592376 RepID=UPI001F581B9C|nr:LysR substrate-binding domain-containing protein [Agromyces atrinae]MCI2957017.1 LysR substrate-binding domain-containing protein [Agromyces atrinae]
MLDVRRLRLLVELDRRGTLAAVADALAYSPSSVSQQLALLEREAGVPLLEKTGRRVQLTPQAHVLVEHATAVLDLLEQAEADVARTLTAVSGVIRVAVFQSAAHAILPRALSDLRAAHPALRVEMVEREPDEGLVELSARDFDLVIAEQYPGHVRELRPDLDRVGLATDAMRLALPPLGVRTEVDAVQSLADAAQLPWVLEPVGTASRQWAVQLCRAAGFEPDVQFETADLTAHVRLIRSGNAVGLVPDLLWTGELPSVRVLDLPGSPRREIFTSTRRAAAGRPSVVACRAALAVAAQAAPGLTAVS